MSRTMSNGHKSVGILIVLVNVMLVLTISAAAQESQEPQEPQEPQELQETAVDPSPTPLPEDGPAYLIE